MVKLRLARRGRKKYPHYDIVAAHSTAPRDGRFIEKIGTYNPNTDPATIVLDEDRAFHWVMVGAQPTETARRILSYRGIMMRRHLQIGVEKGAISQETANERLATWKEDKAKKIEEKINSLSDKATQQQRERLEAERKVSEARAEAIREREQAAAAELAAAEAAATPAENDAPAEGEGTEEAPATEA